MDKNAKDRAFEFPFAGKRAASSTVGMGDSPGKPWDLDMWLGEEASIQTIAHEFGHVMGT